MASLSTPFALKLMRAAASAANLTWPLNGRIFRERLEIDRNCSLWASKTPGYRPRPALKGVIHADLAIIGGGFTGVSTAYYVSRRFPNRRIVLLEAAALANGASGRNGGMMLNWVNGFEDAPPELAARIYRTTSAGIEALCRLIEEHRLPVEYRRDGTATIYTSSARAEAAHAEVEAQNALGIPTRFLNSSELRNYLHIEHGCGAVLDPCTGQINGAQLVRGLAPVLETRGVQIYEGTPVIRIEEGRCITLTTLEGLVRADAIVLATNGYTGALGYFRDALFPLHSHVFATAALPVEVREQLGWRGLAGFSDDLDRISYASMTCDGHLVFGGGGNHAYSYLFNNRTVFPGGAPAARHAHAAMERTLHRYFPSGQALPIAHRWVGTLGVTFDRRPLIGVRGEHRNVYYALGYSGHGVTLANLAGEILCDLYSGDDSRWRDLPFVQSSYPRIPPEPFRWIGYHIFTRLTGKSPRV
ncbi:MAG: FAD-binding oxidoreductase [Caldilinea sp.]|nr:FAD-binding oxidoreductase [Caldilinea sp.]MDW8442561.1 FAD-binding oxidoreductase [Caldilineaceae bacterium]